MHENYALSIPGVGRGEFNATTGIEIPYQKVSQICVHEMTEAECVRAESGLRGQKQTAGIRIQAVARARV